jgi:secreted trypsin-like serine protease
MKVKITITKTLIFSILIFGLIVVAGSAIAIIGGHPDGEAHPYVAAVGGMVNGEMMLCSGAAISSTLLVTAAHCFEDPGQPVLVTFDPDGPLDVNSIILGGLWYPHPEFCLGCGPGLPGFDTNDVAIVELFQPVDLDRYAELPREGLVDSLPMRTKITVVGYGTIGFVVGNGPPEPFSLIQRYFGLTELIKSNHVHSDEYMKITANPAKGKAADCFGDSGGPNLLGLSDTILGITSYGANAMCAGVGYSNRIDTFDVLEFINGFDD